MKKNTKDGDMIEEMEVVPVIPMKIEKVSIDYGREDLNNLAKTVNQLVEAYNAKQ